MAIESIEPVGQGVRPNQEALSDALPSGDGGDDFAAAIERASASRQPDAVQVQPAATIPAPASVETAQPVAATESVETVGATQAAEALERIGDGYARLDSLIAEIRSGQPFTAQELLGLQAEIFKLTVDLKATTEVLSQTIGTVRTLFQQQV